MISGSIYRMVTQYTSYQSIHNDCKGGYFNKITYIYMLSVQRP